MGNHNDYNDYNDEKKPRKRSSRLFGREKEQQQLLDAYRLSQRTSEKSRSVVCIIKGSPGSGKTALANSLKEHLRKENGSMMPWVCDRQAVLQIGPGFIVALRKWVDDMLLLSDEALTEWKCQIIKQFEVFDLAILVKHFPGLEKLFNVEDFPAEVHQEYRYDWSTFQKFLKATSTSDFPLVFVIDDFHWVEWTSFRWIFERMNTAKNEGTFFIVSYNTDLEDQESLWYREVHGLATQGFDVVEISLKELDEEATSSIVADVLGAPQDSIQHVSRCIHGQSMGNPLHTEELLHALCEREILCMQWITH